MGHARSDESIVIPRTCALCEMWLLTYLLYCVGSHDVCTVHVTLRKLYILCGTMLHVTFVLHVDVWHRLLWNFFLNDSQMKKSRNQFENNNHQIDRKFWSKQRIKMADGTK